MIASIKGKIVERLDNSVIIDTGVISYEVLVPVSVLQRLQESQDSDGNVRLITYHYLQVSNSSANEILVGFLNTIERDFFLEFIKVSGIGPGTASRALNKSIGEIAQAIDRADTKYLKALPGIGEQKAKDIIAKLQGKLGRFTLMRDHVEEAKPGLDLRDIEQEALHVLLQLQYKKLEAEEMINKAIERNKQISTAEELLNEIYNQRKSPVIGDKQRTS